MSSALTWYPTFEREMALVGAQAVVVIRISIPPSHAFWFPPQVTASGGQAILAHFGFAQPADQFPEVFVRK